jgi:UDP:flavonoid glycosyltransferase YjiC (YdhE family)
VPVRNQYEQVLNARYLEQLGYGLEAPKIEAELLRLFLSEAPRYAARLAKHKQDGNRDLFALVDRLLERFAQKKKRSKDREH